MLPGLTSPIGSARPRPLVTYIGSASSNTTLTTYTFSSQSIGGPGLIVVNVMGGASTSNLISSVTIGGVSATLARKSDNANYIVGTYYRRITSGTTATIAVTFSASMAQAAINVYRIQDNLYDAPYASAAASAAASPSVSLNVPDNGVIIGGMVSSESTGSATWTGATENVDSAFGPSRYSAASASDLAAQTGRTIRSAMSVSGNARLVACSWT